MAYLTPLSRCYGDSTGPCKRPATVEVKGLRNESYGKFCKPHGQKKLKVVLAREKEEANRRSVDAARS